MPRCPCLPCEHRWEVVARLHTRPRADGTPARSWIVPASEGRHFRASYVAARWTAHRWTRRARRTQDPTLTGPRMTWEVRQTPLPTLYALIAAHAPKEPRPC